MSGDVLWACWSCPCCGGRRVSHYEEACRAAAAHLHGQGAQATEARVVALVQTWMDKAREDLDGEAQEEVV